MRDVSYDDRVISAWHFLALSKASKIVYRHATVQSHEIVGSVSQVHKLGRKVANAGVSVGVGQLRVGFIE